VLVDPGPRAEVIVTAGRPTQGVDLRRRVELLVPIRDPEIKAFLKDVYLDAYLRDNVNARTLRPDGSYRKIPGTDPFDAQMFFIGRDIVCDMKMRNEK